MFRYSKDHIDFLESGYKQMKVQDLADAFNEKYCLNKSNEAIHSILLKNGIRCGRKPSERLITRRRLFNKEQEKYIRRNYKLYDIGELIEEFNKTFKACMTRNQIKGFITRYNIKSGRTGRFHKGHKPWNTGTKGQGLTIRNRGSFKKGNIPKNIKPIGSERICSKDGYILIKINENNPYTECPTRYKLKHVYLWERANGSVPKGFVVMFKDGCKENCNLKNLALVSRAELLRLNKNKYRGAPKELKPSVMALSKLQARTFFKEREMGYSNM